MMQKKFSKLLFAGLCLFVSLSSPKLAGAGVCEDHQSFCYAGCTGTCGCRWNCDKAYYDCRNTIYGEPIPPLSPKPLCLES
jgi:hypothetical protein